MFKDSSEVKVSQFASGSIVRGKVENSVISRNVDLSDENDDASLGAVVGRVANRIKDGHFTLNGKEYQLAVNCGTNHLHGGLIGYASKPWDAKIKDDKLILTMISADGEEGYPGNLTLTVTYGWSEDNELSIVYEASADQDKQFSFLTIQHLPEREL